MNEITMFDSIRVDQLPVGAAAVAGYVNGSWPTYPTLAARFPKAHRLSIAVTSHADADCLDVEKGDATIQVAPDWVKRQMALGNKRPVLYTSVSQAPPLLDALAAHGIRRQDIRLWTAHYNFRPHLCSSWCGFGMAVTADATQWTDRALGRNLDASLVSPGFFPEAPTVLESAPAGEAKNQSPFTRAVWPIPLPEWFWAWAQWRLDGQTYQRPWNAPNVIPPWAWARMAQLGKPRDGG